MCVDNGDKRFKGWVLGYFIIRRLGRWVEMGNGDWERIVCEVGGK